MSSRVTVYERPRRFVDEQVRGPFRSMWHERLFEAAGDGLVRMTDRMTVVAPLGVLGSAVLSALLAPYLRRLLATRPSGQDQVFSTDRSRLPGQDYTGRRPADRPP